MFALPFDMPDECLFASRDGNCSLRRSFKPQPNNRLLLLLREARDLGVSPTLSIHLQVVKAMRPGGRNNRDVVCSQEGVQVVQRNLGGFITGVFVKSVE